MVPKDTELDMFAAEWPELGKVDLTNQGKGFNRRKFERWAGRDSNPWPLGLFPLGYQPSALAKLLC